MLRLLKRLARMVRLRAPTFEELVEDLRDTELELHALAQVTYADYETEAQLLEKAHDQPESDFWVAFHEHREKRMWRNYIDANDLACELSDLLADQDRM